MKKLILFLFFFTSVIQIYGKVEILRYNNVQEVFKYEYGFLNTESANDKVKKDSLQSDSRLDSLFYNFIQDIATKGEDEVDYNKYPESWRYFTNFFRDNCFLYRDIFYYNSNSYFNHDTIQLTFNDILEADGINKCKYFYIKNINNFEIDLAGMAIMGGEWHYNDMRNLTVNKYGDVYYFDKRNYMRQNYDEEYDFNPLSLVKLPYKHLDVTLDYISESSDSLEPMQWELGFWKSPDGMNEFDGYFDKLMNIKILNSDIKEISFSGCNSVNITHCNVDNFIIKGECNKVHLSYSIVNDIELPNTPPNATPFIIIETTFPFQLEMIENTISQNLKFYPQKISQKYGFILDNNIFENGIDFDWQVLKEANLNVSDGDNKAERMTLLYSTLKSNLLRRNRHQEADDCHYESKEYLRKNYFKDSNTDFFSKTAKTMFYYIDWISTGYGTKPLRIFPYSIIVILIFAFIYFLKPDSIENLHEIMRLDKLVKYKLKSLPLEELKKKFASIKVEDIDNKDELINYIFIKLKTRKIVKLAKMPILKDRLTQLWTCIYFSFCTFTTIGVGDWYPRSNFSKLLVILEGALGWISLGLFITAYGNLLLR